MEYIILPSKSKIYLPERGYFKKGDSGESIELISSFLAINFMGIENKINVKIDDMLGNYFGVNLEKWIQEFQRENGLKPDGCIGSITLNKLKEYGFTAWS